jgi:hypothetical protein
MVAESLKVWVRDEATVWARATLQQGASSTATLADGTTREGPAEELAAYPQNALLRAEGPNGNPGVPDMTGVAHLHEAAVLQNLELRHAAKRPYTWCGGAMWSGDAAAFSLPRPPQVRKYPGVGQSVHFPPQVGGQRGAAGLLQLGDAGLRGAAG